MISRLIAVALALSLVGCVSGKKLSDIGAATPAPSGPAWSIPLGVVASPGATLTSAIDGLYPSVPGDKTCCWVASHATLATRKDAPASRLDVSVFIPDYPFFSAHRQSFRLSLEGSAPVERCCYGPGVATIALDLPAARRAFVGVVPLTVESKYAFVPAHEGVNTDTRALGAIVLRVDYRS
jgi:hypothetical protein